MDEKKKTVEKKIKKLPQANKPEQTKATPEQTKATPEQTKPTPPTVQQIIEAYPADREKARDLLLLSIVIELGKISNTMEWFAKRKQEDIDKNITLKP
jgi:hypothetical protein